MCSTPKLKRSNHGKTLASSTSILATINSTQRLAFAERANEASEHRLLQLSSTLEKDQKTHSSTKGRHLKREQLRSHQHKVKQTWLYWLLSASITDVIHKLIKH